MYSSKTQFQIPDPQCHSLHEKIIDGSSLVVIVGILVIAVHDVILVIGVIILSKSKVNS